MPKGFEKGNKLAKGGARIGSGRKPDAYKAALKRICESPEAIGFLRKAVKGEEVDVRLHDGNVISLPATADTRHKIWESVHDRVHGKPGNVIDISQMEEGAEIGIGIVMLPSNKKVK